MYTNAFIVNVFVKKISQFIHNSYTTSTLWKILYLPLKKIFKD
jgi:hypothetical protein